VVRRAHERGLPTGERDLIIAATAMAHGLTMVTNNAREVFAGAGAGGRGLVGLTALQAHLKKAMTFFKSA
jgi:hypothetical protein